jgi:hypothetical protein
LRFAAHLRAGGGEIADYLVIEVQLEQVFVLLWAQDDIRFGHRLWAVDRGIPNSLLTVLRGEELLLLGLLLRRRLSLAWRVCDE